MKTKIKEAQTMEFKECISFKLVTHEIETPDYNFNIHALQEADKFNYDSEIIKTCLHSVISGLHLNNNDLSIKAISKDLKGYEVFVNDSLKCLIFFGVIFEYSDLIRLYDLGYFSDYYLLQGIADILDNFQDKKENAIALSNFLDSYLYAKMQQNDNLAKLVEKTLKDKIVDYGEFSDFAYLVYKLKIHLNVKNNITETRKETTREKAEFELGELMLRVKLARILTTNCDLSGRSLDSLIDFVGYAKLLYEAQKENNLTIELNFQGDAYNITPYCVNNDYCKKLQLIIKKFNQNFI